MLTMDQERRITPGEALQHQFVTLSHLVDYAHCSNVKASVQMMEVCRRSHYQPPNTLGQQGHSSTPAGSLVANFVPGTNGNVTLTFNSQFAAAAAAAAAVNGQYPAALYNGRNAVAAAAAARQYAAGMVDVIKQTNKQTLDAALVFALVATIPIFYLFLLSRRRRCCSSGSFPAPVCVLAAVPAVLSEFDVTVQASGGGGTTAAPIAAPSGSLDPTAICSGFYGGTVWPTGLVGHSRTGLLAWQPPNDVGSFLAAVGS
jgi:hypothetical protein